MDATPTFIANRLYLIEITCLSPLSSDYGDWGNQYIARVIWFKNL